MTAISEEDGLLTKTQDIVSHFSQGGTLKSLANIGSDELEAVYAVAYNHFTAKKYASAIELFKFLCLYDHTEPRWFFALGVTQQQNGEYSEAINSFGLATILDIQDPRPQIQAGYCLAALKRWPEAQSALEGAIIACGNELKLQTNRQQAEALLETVKNRKQEGGN
ncbi:MAG: SycD/LcrH family type III secretion system chaperone [Planctomycetota bacterium]|jgi:type III secretion system low calcium response chaperone LcrH/SycD|nr:SycD/LcrH family type III secretion system chaperone [Planctomycetota bacterium]